MKATLALVFAIPALANVLVRGGHGYEHEEKCKPETKTVTCTETVTKPVVEYKTVTCTETVEKTVYKTEYKTDYKTVTAEKPVEKPVYKTEYKTDYQTVTADKPVEKPVYKTEYKTEYKTVEKPVEKTCPTVYITNYATVTDYATATKAAPPPPPPPAYTSSVAASAPTQVTVSGASRAMSWGPAAVAAAVAGFMALM